MNVREPRLLRRLAKLWLPPIVQDALRSALRPAPPAPPSDGMLEFERLGLKWRLDMRSNIAQEMFASGQWEPETTRLIADMVRPGMKALSVGANFGYYVILMARQVGPSGHVWAFEPTQYYRDQLNWHIDNNGFGERVTVLPYGLSDHVGEAVIDISPQSASMHYSPQEVRMGQETIRLTPLDSVAGELGLDRIDFVSVDIDGHEPAFLKGAAKTLSRDLPPIAMEFAQECLHFAGSDVRELAALLDAIGYEICAESTRQPYESELAFLKACGNFKHYANAVAMRRRPPPDEQPPAAGA